MVLGTGLLITLKAEANWAKTVLYQTVIGAGVSMNFEGPLLALQASNAVQDTATATSTIGFVRMLASAMLAIIGSVVFQNQMEKEGPALLAAFGSEIAGLLSGGQAAGNADVVKTLPAGLQVIAKGAYQRSLRAMWIMVRCCFFDHFYSCSAGADFVVCGRRCCWLGWWVFCCWASLDQRRHCCNDWAW